MVLLVPAKMAWPHSLLFLPLITKSHGWNTTKRKDSERWREQTDWGLWILRNDVAVSFLGFFCFLYFVFCLSLIYLKGGDWWWRSVQHGTINRYNPKLPRNLFPIVKGLEKGWPNRIENYFDNIHITVGKQKEEPTSPHGVSRAQWRARLLDPSAPARYGELAFHIVIGIISVVPNGAELPHLPGSKETELGSVRWC